MKLLLVVSAVLIISGVSFFTLSKTNAPDKIANSNSNTLGITTTKDSSLMTYEVTPKGPINPGDSYEINLQVKNPQGELCKQCGIKVYFSDYPPGQAGDEVTPVLGRVDNQGHYYVKVASFVPGHRDLIVDVRSSEEILNSSTIALEFNNNGILGFMRLVTKTVNQMGSLPPFGNIYVRAVKQRYIGDGKRDIDLEWNMPFGTRRVDIYANSISSPNQLVKTTSESKTTITVDATEKVNIQGDACTVKTSCVGAFPLSIDKIASESGEIDVPNHGFLDPEEQILEFQKKNPEPLENFGPLKFWLEGVYKTFN